MSEELKPVKCGCGGEAYLYSDVNEHTGVIRTYCECRKCGIRTHPQLSKENAIKAWNTAMRGNTEEKLKAFWDGMSAEMKEERTAKVKEEWGLAMCCACKKRVFPYDKYCSHCGARLEWDE